MPKGRGLNKVFLRAFLTSSLISIKHFIRGTPLVAKQRNIKKKKLAQSR